MHTLPFLCRGVSCIVALQCMARPPTHPSATGDLPGRTHPSSPLQQGRGKGCLQAAGLYRAAARRWEQNREQLCHAATANQPFVVVSCARSPVQPKDHCRRAVIAGHGQGGWEGNQQRTKSRTGEYACMRQRKEEKLTKDAEKDRNWMMIKTIGYLHLSPLPTFQLTVQITWYVLR